MDPLISFGIIALAVFVLTEAGKGVVRSLGVMARYLNVSEYVLSFILIAFATSLPELSVGINSAFLGVPELSFGDILGSNIVNFTLVLGLVAVVGGSIALRDYEHFKSNRLFEFVVVLSPLILLLDGVLSRLDGVILLVLFVWNLFRLLDIDDMILGRKVLRPHLSEHVFEKVTTREEFLENIALFCASVCVLLGSTLVIVLTVKELSVAFGISQVLIGVLFIAVATSLPDFVIGVRSAYRKMGGIALGDLFGAAAINSTLTLGVVALISPIVLTDMLTLWIGIGFTVVVFLLVFVFLETKNSISRTEGFVLVVLYGLFVVTQLGIHFFTGI